jgi:cytochrome c-type biogenesis protein CcsB
MTPEPSQIQLLLLNLAGIGPVAAFWLFVLAQASKRWQTTMINAGLGTMALTSICLGTALVLRGFEAGRFPLSNLYESILWFAFFVTAAFLYIVLSQGKAEWARDKTAIASIGWMAALVAAAMLIYGSWLPATQHEIKPLVPALVSYWRQIHVPPLICSYALFFISGAAALLQLYNFGCLRSVIILIATVMLAGLSIALGTFTEIDTWVLQVMYTVSSVVGVFAAWKQLKHRAPTPASASALAPTLQTASLFDEVSSRCISIGVPLLTFGIITGGLWANHAWGTYWSWDPKESMALTTWLAYAAYIHLRMQHELPAEKLSVVAVVGLLLTLLTYLGFNSLGFGGLHSYGRFKS